MYQTMAQSKIKLAIFDLDGTLINSVADLGQATNHALQLHGFPMHDLSKYNYFVGNGVTKLIERALPEQFRDEATIEKVKSDFLDYYMRHKTDLTRPYDGIPELLHVLQEKSVKIAVASNKFIAGTQALVKGFFPDIDFCAVLGQREGVPIKPDPYIANEALQLAGVDRGDCLYVGDTATDMQTASNAGLESVGVSWGFRPVSELKDAGAAHIIDKPAELLSLVDSE